MWGAPEVRAPSACPGCCANLAFHCAGSTVVASAQVQDTRHFDVHTFCVSLSNLKDAAGLDRSRSGRFSRLHGSPLSLPPYGSPAVPMRSAGAASIGFGNYSRAALGSRQGFDVFSHGRAVEPLSRSHRLCPEPFHAKPDPGKAPCRS